MTLGAGKTYNMNNNRIVPLPAPIKEVMAEVKKARDEMDITCDRETASKNFQLLFLLMVQIQYGHHALQNITKDINA